MQPLLERSTTAATFNTAAVLESERACFWVVTLSDSRCSVPGCLRQRERVWQSCAFKTAVVHARASDLVLLS